MFYYINLGHETTSKECFKIFFHYFFSTKCISIYVNKLRLKPMTHFYISCLAKSSQSNHLLNLESKVIPRQVYLLQIASLWSFCCLDESKIMLNQNLAIYSRTSPVFTFILNVYDVLSKKSPL